MIKAKLIVLGKQWESSGKTIEEALAKFGLDWVQVKGKGVLTITSGSKYHEHLFNMRELRKVFSNKVVRLHWAKNLAFLLKDNNKSNIPIYGEETIDGRGNDSSEDPIPARRGRKAKSSTKRSSRDSEVA